jgi:BirA family biotin operon repressor/biotin-[acetyl-CoA-carboxylase] ligase
MDRKLCGILIENVIEGGCVARSIIGTGLNLNQVIFRGAAPNPVSLLQITGLACDPLYMLDLLRNEFHLLAGRLADGRAEEIHREYVASLYRAEAFYPYEDAGGRFVARIRDIEPSGHLLLERLDGSLSRYAFKEVCYKNEE